MQSRLIVVQCRLMLVGGFNLPLWEIWVRQLGWWKIKFMFQTTNQNATQSRNTALHLLLRLCELLQLLLEILVHRVHPNLSGRKLFNGRSAGKETVNSKFIPNSFQIHFGIRSFSWGIVWTHKETGNSWDCAAKTITHESQEASHSASRESPRRIDKGRWCDAEVRNVGTKHGKALINLPYVDYLYMFIYLSTHWW